VRDVGREELRGRLRGGGVRVRVPASSANLGPGFDSLGLSLAVYDELEVQAVPDGLVVEVRGAGAGEVPTGEDHLVVQAIRAGLAHAGVPQPGLHLRCRNAIPHGRGLGSSASAAVAGVVAARGLLADPGAIDDDDALLLANVFEGHPDNVAASLYGSFTLSWVDEELDRPRAVRLDVHPDVVPVACVPAEELPTSKARAMLPREVPHADAAYNAGRAALLVQALTRRPDLLLPATQDRLHQRQRACAMPATWDLVCALRAEGLAAVVSGAGPTALVLGVGANVRERAASIAGSDWEVLAPGIDLYGVTWEPLGAAAR
jgi:homoserine kinase